MGKKMKRKWMAIVLMSTMMMGVLSGCGDKEVAQETNSKVEKGTKETADKGEKATPKEENQEIKEEDLVVIRYGSHCALEEDPNYKDPVTGNYRMDEETRQIKLEALEVVKEELGVDFQFVQYPGNVSEVLLQSVLAGDPIADVVRISQGYQGIILGQNVLQPVDEYADLIPKEAMDLYGKKYFIQINGDNWITLSPLLFNIAYIEEVPGLKVDGETVYPTDLYLSGDWTWSVFKDYLQTIDSYYANSQAPVRQEQRIKPYHTDYREAALLAIHSNGGSIYGAEGLAIDSLETLEAIEYIEDLMDNKLITADLKEGTSEPVKWQGADVMKMGETVFTNIHDWLTYSVASGMAERGHSMGYVPFPRPDDMAFDDVNYRQARNGGESYAILKGIDEEKVPLAIESFFLYNETVEKLSEEIYGEEDSNVLKNPHVKIDTFHPEIGAEMHKMYWDVVNEISVCEVSDMVGVEMKFYEILGDSLYGINGSPQYDVAIESKKSIITEMIESTEQLLETDNARDNILPKITQVEPKFYAFPVETDLSQIDFTVDVEAKDNVDGVLDRGQIKVDYSKVDATIIGKYTDSLELTIVDSAGNKGMSVYPVVIFDPANTEGPSITIKEDYKKIAVDTEVAKINWRNDFIADMVDADGIPVEIVVPDVSELDTTKPGVYPVVLRVEDFAGNKTEISIDITVE